MKKFFIPIMLFLLCFSFSFNCVFAAQLKLVYDGEEHDYYGSTYKLMINGEFIETSVEPLLFNDYALVPIREVCESMGATVKYVNSSKKIYITFDDTYLHLQIGNNKAYLNSDEILIPGGVTPMLISLAGEAYAKTMVPIRFVSESLGLKVDFDGDNGIIKITGRNSSDTQDEETVKSTIYEYSCTKINPKTVTLKIYFDTEIKEITSPKLTDAGVLYFDVPDSKYSIKTTNEINEGAIKNLRVGLHETYTRIAIDTENMAEYNVNLSNDKKIILVTVTSDAEIKENPDEDTKQDDTDDSGDTDKTEDNNKNDKDEDNKNPVTRPPANTNEKIVVIDAGHGGQDPGALGTDSEGKEHKEKDLNLEIAKRVRDILEENGITVIMTRDGDTFPTLTDRSDIANAHQAVIFASIHANSATSDTVSGFEVYYSTQNNSDATGLSSHQLAKSVTSAIDDKISIRNRGVKTADHIVTKTSIMPAILIEVGFMSNPDELSLMLTDDFRSNFSQGIANGIMAVFDDANIPEKITKLTTANTDDSVEELTDKTTDNSLKDTTNDDSDETNTDTDDETKEAAAGNS